MRNIFKRKEKDLRLERFIYLMENTQELDYMGEDEKMECIWRHLEWMIEQGLVDEDFKPIKKPLG